MLMLNRKLGQGLWIGDTFVKFHKRKGNAIVLAIDAPPEVLVLREEVERADGAGDQERDRESAAPHPPATLVSDADGDCKR